MNAYLASYSQQGCTGQRKPKNQNNNLAFLDGVSEAINNHIYRQGTVALGMSSSISGSGVVFQYDLLRRKLGAMNSIGGFDRELELQLLLEGINVRYYKEAAIYDEKSIQNTKLPEPAQTLDLQPVRIPAQILQKRHGCAIQRQLHLLQQRCA